MTLFGRRNRWFVREADRFAVNLPPGLGAILVQLGGELRDLLVTDADVVRRVFPVAYPDDDEREAGYQAMVRGELIERHQEGIDLIGRTVDADALTEQEMTRWLTTLNAIRLILGTALDVDEDEDLDLDEDDPRFPVQQLYFVLSEVVVQILRAFADD